MYVACAVNIADDSGEQVSDNGKLVSGFFLRRDAELVRALRNGHPGAPAEFFDRYGAYVERVLVRVLGNDNEIEDLLHEVFAEALDHLDQLRDEARLKAWLTRLTVFRARGAIRYRQRRRWLVFRPSDEMETESAPDAHDSRELLRRLFVVLKQMRADERIAFSLRYLEGMKLAEAADACDVALATFKRRLGRANRSFMRLAENDPDLYERLMQTPRWGQGHA